MTVYRSYPPVAPFTIALVSALVTALLQPEDAGDGSAVLNIARNLGGSVGTAMLDTILTPREQFQKAKAKESLAAH